jgi:cyanate lyase
MTTPEITETILAAKGAKGLSFGALGALIGRDEVWVAAVAYRQASASTEEAEKLTDALGLGPDVAEVLTRCPTKGLGPVVPGQICSTSPHTQRSAQEFFDIRR